MILLRLVASQTISAVDLRPPLVRRMTAHTILVALLIVQRRFSGSLVATGAVRRARRPQVDPSFASVWTVASAAPGRQPIVRIARVLVLVATGALLGRMSWLLGMRVVAFDAGLVPSGGALVFHLVAGRTGFGHVTTVRFVAIQAGVVFVRRVGLRLVAIRAVALHVSGMMRQTLMTILARLVARIVLGRVHFLPVAALAQRLGLCGTQELVWLVALGTSQVLATMATLLMGHAVASGARGGSVVHVGPSRTFGMDVVAAGAGPGHVCQRWMIRLLSLVTVRARRLCRRSHVVRRMTVAALSVRRDAWGTQGRMSLMTTFTGLGGRGPQVVVVVTTGALLVAPRKGRVRVDLRRALHPMTLVALGAGLPRRGRGAVGPMAIQTLIDDGARLCRSSAVLEVYIVVATGARLRRQCLVAMGLMAGQARLIGVDLYGGVITLGRLVATQTILWALEVARCSPHLVASARVHRPVHGKLVTKHAFTRLALLGVVGG